MSAIIVIPARLQSSRLPGKLLLPAGSAGKSILQYTYEQASRTALADAVYVASDGSPEIATAVRGFGGRLIETDAQHANGTLRVAETARRLAWEGPLRTRLNQSSIVVNWQADEPEADPAAVDAMIRQLANLLAGEISIAMPRDCERVMNASAQPRILTLAAPFPLCSSPHDWSDSNIVKVAVAGGADATGGCGGSRAMYFSRSSFIFAKHHVGVYAFTFDALMDVPGMPPSSLAQAESLEQLQWLEAGKKIGVVMMPRAVGGINTRYDYEAFCRRLGERKLQGQVNGG